MMQPDGGSATRRRAATALAAVSLLGAVGIGRADAQILIGGQSSNVSNTGGAQANTGGNSSTGNASSNTATNTSTTNNGGVLGSLVGVNLGLGAPANTSGGTSNVATGPATATGNQTGTSVDQTSAGGGGRRGGAAPVQSSGVSNDGAAVANTGGNTGVGNNSENTAANTVTGPAGLVDVDLTLGGPTNNSTGTSNIATGAANAAGNVADTTVDQTVASGQAVGGHGGDKGVTFVPGVGFVPTAGGACSNLSVQRTTVVNRGEALANTGGNTSVGNNSTNVATNEQTISGGLVGLGINLGGPTNNSDGSSTIVTGPADAVGNQSTTTVDQTCVGFVPLTHRGHAHGHVHTKAVTTKAGHLARTGAEAPDLALMAGALLFGGTMMVVPARRRRQQAAAAEVATSD